MSYDKIKRKFDYRKSRKQPTVIFTNQFINSISQPEYSKYSKWKVEFQTQDTFMAGTDATFRFHFVASEPIGLKASFSISSAGDLFERGHNDLMYIIGSHKKIKWKYVTIYNQGGSVASSWSLAWLTVENLQTDEKFESICNCNIDTNLSVILNLVSVRRRNNKKSSTGNEFIERKRKFHEIRILNNFLWHKIMSYYTSMNNSTTTQTTKLMTAETLVSTSPKQNIKENSNSIEKTTGKMDLSGKILVDDNSTDSRATITNISSSTSTIRLSSTSTSRTTSFILLRNNIEKLKENTDTNEISTMSTTNKMENNEHLILWNLPLNSSVDDNSITEYSSTMTNSIDNNFSMDDGITVESETFTNSLNDEKVTNVFVDSSIAFELPHIIKDISNVLNNTMSNIVKSNHDNNSITNFTSSTNTPNLLPTNSSIMSNFNHSMSYKIGLYDDELISKSIAEEAVLSKNYKLLISCIVSVFIIILMLCIVLFKQKSSWEQIRREWRRKSSSRLSFGRLDTDSCESDDKHKKFDIIEDDLETDKSSSYDLWRIVNENKNYERTIDRLWNMSESKFISRKNAIHPQTSQQSLKRTKAVLPQNLLSEIENNRLYLKNSEPATQLNEGPKPSCSTEDVIDNALNLLMKGTKEFNLEKPNNYELHVCEIKNNKKRFDYTKSAENKKVLNNLTPVSGGTDEGIFDISEGHSSISNSPRMSIKPNDSVAKNV
ncbi:hypothetical protein SNEBB_004537 [Seison nebaliae]|nr:hypothetical protein SNEBB_004537 [Seison nebaliae]